MFKPIRFKKTNTKSLERRKKILKTTKQNKRANKFQFIKRIPAHVQKDSIKSNNQTPNSKMIKIILK